MKTLEEGKKRIQYICDSIRYDTLEPAKLEALRLLAESEQQKLALIAEGKKEKERLIQAAREEIEKERAVFNASLIQATQQAVESLKQHVENELFKVELENLLREPFLDPQIIANIVSCLIKAIEKEGLSVDLEAQIAKNVNPESVNKLIGQRIVERLKKKSVEIGHFAGGAKIEIKDRNMQISLTLDEAKHLLADYLRKDFRKLIFAS